MTLFVRRVAIAVAVVVAVTAGSGLWARARAVEHVRRVTGRTQAATLNCAHCHWGASTVSYGGGPSFPDPADLLLSPDGRRLYVACKGTDRIEVLDAKTLAFVEAKELEGGPHGLALSPAGDELYVSLERRDELAVLALPSMAREKAIRVAAAPAGLAVAARVALVACSVASKISVVDLDSGAERLRLDAGREPWGVAVSPDGKRAAFIARRAAVGRAERLPSSELTILDAATGRVLHRAVLPSCHLGEALAWTPDGRYVLAPALHTHNRLPIVQVARGWVTHAVLGVVEASTGRVAVLPLDPLGHWHADPSGLALSPDGQRLYLAAGGSDLVAVYDLPLLLAAAAEPGSGDFESAEDNARPAYADELGRAAAWHKADWKVGDVPNAVLAGPDGSVYVAERLDGSVARLDGATGAVLARRMLAGPAASTPEHRGQSVFHDASYSFQGQFSCRSCHAGMHTDGLRYDFEIDGISRDRVINRSLGGLKDTGPFKWNGKNPTLARQCGPRFAMVLTRADPFPEDRLADLVAFLESLPPPRAPGSGDPAAAARGRVIFERAVDKKGQEIPPKQRCVTCHPPPHYTNRLFEDVGTRTSEDNAEFDVPHLTGVADKAPYLHDGRASTLEEIWTLPGVEDKHGRVLDLNKKDLNDLIEFMRGL